MGHNLCRYTSCTRVVLDNIDGLLKPVSLYNFSANQTEKLPAQRYPIETGKPFHQSRINYFSVATTGNFPIMTKLVSPFDEQCYSILPARNW